MPTSPNIRKAAILLASLPRDEACRLLARFDRRQIARLTSEIAQLESLSDDQRQPVLAEFAEALSESGARCREFSFLKESDLPHLVAILPQEHPQTAAVLLAHLPRQTAVRVIAQMPAASQATTIRRIATLESVDSQVLRELGIALRLRLAELRLPPAAAVRRSA